MHLKQIAIGMDLGQGGRIIRSIHLTQLSSIAATFNAMQSLANASLASLIAAPDRLDWAVLRLDLPGGELRFDWAKTHLTLALRDALLDHAANCGLDHQIDGLLSGAIVNPTEKRAAEHTAQRGVGSEDAVALAAEYHAKTRGLISAIDAGVMGEVKHLIHIGIGGSALGPAMMIDALARDADRYDVHVVSNIDGAALAAAFKACDPARTIIAIASKTFTTIETLTNAETALVWLRENGVADGYGRCIALTAAPAKAVEWGIDESRILPFSESVGGRYSLWSSIGFPIALAIGWDGFDQMLRGAAAMDQHFASASWQRNAPILAACVDQLYLQLKHCQTRAVFAYDERLRLVPDYLQQLEMESNGKSVDLEGRPVDYPTAPVTWGGVGTDAQHAVFQLLHQGSHLIPVEFLASLEAGHDLDPVHHKILLTNCFAQGAALLAGKTSEDPARSYAGDRPSTTILLEDVTPGLVGALIAFYEHRTFANAVMLGINPFDQFGVELGKAMAKAAEAGEGADFDASTRALLDLAGLGA